MLAWAFDLGDTLVEYEGLPLSWVEHYPAALGRLASFLGLEPGAAQIDAACRVLRGYNTRLQPREREVSFAQILAEMGAGFSAPAAGDPAGAARAFFSEFRQHLRCFPDARPALAALKGQGAPIALFTDVPYGMPRFLVLEDIGQSGLTELLDLVVTSEEIGLRKPAPGTLAGVASRLGCGAAELTYVGNERKDIAAAVAFGCTGILLDRSGRRPAWGQDRTISSLTELLSPLP